MSRQLISTAEIVRIFNISRQAAAKWVKAANWPQPVDRAGVGGVFRFDVSCLPEYLLTNTGKPGRPIRTVVLQWLADQSKQPEQISKEVAIAVSQPVALKDWQRATAEARGAILNEVRRLSVVLGREKSILKLVVQAAEGALPEHLANLVTIANQKAGKSGKRTLSRPTIYRWFAEQEHGFNALAPKADTGFKIPQWGPKLLDLYRQPQKPSLAYCVEQLKDISPELDLNYDAARRFLMKVSPTELQRGRMGSRERKNIMPFVRRDTSNNWPTDFYTADGHTFDAEIAHPAHGRPFRPEVTSILDGATRKVVGWSIDLAESGLAVLDALRAAVENGGIPAIFYVDNGSGYRNAMMSAPGTGMAARLGFEISHSIAYNSQARGLIERLHQTLWIKASKELPTYMGAEMDREAKHNVFKLIRSDIKNVGQSKRLMPFAAFVKFAEHKVLAYNDRPHRGLPKVRDESGRQRHMTPNEAWEQALNEGWTPVTITSNEARELFRPVKECQVSRGEIRLFNNLYFSRDLEHHHREVVRVGYDIHSADKVWVYDYEGRFICEAGFEANKRAYFPESFVDQAKRKRAEGRKARLEAHLDEVEAELNPPIYLEHIPSEKLEFTSDLMLDTDVVISPHESMGNEAKPLAQIQQTSIAEALPDVRPLFDTESSQYRWLMKHRTEWTEFDRSWLKSFVNDWLYESLAERFEADGIAWKGDDSEGFKEAI